MNTKLTLSIDKEVIESAKRDLQSRGESLSHLIEEYFKALLSAKARHFTDTPVVAELTGIAKTSKDTNEKDIISDYLLEKYK